MDTIGVKLRSSCVHVDVGRGRGSRGR